MKYIYISEKEDKVALIAKRHVEERAEDWKEYIVSDDFDMTKEVDSMEDPGTKIKLEGFLTPAEFLERYNANYVQKRLNAYPPIDEQLDKIYHEGIDAWKAEIKAIKDANPKG